MIRTVALATALTTAVSMSTMAADYSTSAPANTTTATSSTAATPTTAATTAAVPAPTVATKSGQPDANILLTEELDKAWKDKPVYSSDGSNLGEVVDFQRGTDAKVIGMHADIGGFLGLMQTRVNLTTAQFKLQGDRVVLTLTAAQAKALPAVKI